MQNFPTLLRQRASLLIVVVLTALSSCQDNYVVDRSSLCNCTDDIDNECYGLKQNWDFTVNHLLGVSANDFKRGEYVGTECQGETNLASEWWPFYFNSWRPVDGYKYNMAATLHEFNWTYNDDEDWNMHLVPNPPFSNLISDVEALHGESADDHNRDGLKTMEAEISPDKQFWNNPWFFKPGASADDAQGNGYSWLQGRQMGFYGLWIMDANHDFKSEIHPANMMWFKDRFEGGFGNSGPFDIFWLFLMQDNTGRFDDRDNFDCDGDAPAGWESWEQSPKSGQFNIAFEVNPATEVVSFSIAEIFRRFVVTSSDADASKDADNGTSHALQYNGKVVVKVEETQPNDEDLGVSFTNLCLRPDGKLQGFVSIRSMVGGDDDKDEEGFHILYVTRSLHSGRPVINPPLPKGFPKVMASYKGVPGSVKDAPNYFMGDLKLTLTGNDSAGANDYSISSVYISSGLVSEAVKFEQTMGAKEVYLKNVPLVHNGKLLITTSSGLTFQLSVPAIGLTPGVKDSIISSKDGTDANRFIAQAVGSRNTNTVTQKLSHVRESLLQVMPHYSLFYNDEPGDADSSLAEDINQSFANNKIKIEALFGKGDPINVSWKFEAKNISSGKPVPVFVNTPGKEQGVSIENKSTKGDSLRIKFLSTSASGIIELHATGIISDTKGNSRTIEHFLWSHQFPITANIDEVASLAQQVTGIKDRAVFLPAKTDQKRRELFLTPNDQLRHRRILNNYLRHMVKDRYIKIDELRRLTNACKKFGMN